jgi:hypothetical protein
MGAPHGFPWVIGVFTFGKELLWSKSLIPTRASDSEPEIDPDPGTTTDIFIVSWIAGFLLAIWLLGFTYAAAAATFLYLKLGSGEKRFTSIALALVAWALFYGVFDHTSICRFQMG